MEPLRLPGSMALLGAEMLLYPTAIGTFAVPPDQIDDEPDHYDHWQNVMLGHAAANVTPVIASNRIGVEEMGGTAVRFWGASFISDNRGNKIAEADTRTEGILTATFDLDEAGGIQKRSMYIQRPKTGSVRHTHDARRPDEITKAIRPDRIENNTAWKYHV